MPESFNDYVKMKEEVANDIMSRLHPILGELQQGQNDLKKQIEPMSNIFVNVDGAFNVSKWIFIGLAGVGVGLGGLYAIIYEIKLFFRTH